VLIHLLTVDPDPEREPLSDFKTLQKELAQFDPALAKRPTVVALSKLDLPEAREALPALQKALKRRGILLHAISAATGEGLDALLDAVEPLLSGGGEIEAEIKAEVKTPARKPRKKAAAPPARGTARKRKSPSSKASRT